MNSMTQEQEHAVEEFRHAAGEFMAKPTVGTRYALEMAAAECKLLGIDPSTIEPSEAVAHLRGGQ